MEKIIRGEKARQLFANYVKNVSQMWGRPTNVFHPNDLEKLDRFIVIYKKTHRIPMHYSLLKKWLIDEQNWSDKDAEYCTQRIKTGWEILTVEKKEPHYRLLETTNELRNDK